MRPRLYCLILFSFTTCSLFAQYSDLVGATQQELVTFQPDGNIILRQSITGLPSPAVIRNLSYVVSEDTYYVLINTTDNPSLVPIAADGTAGATLLLTFDGAPLPLVEAAAYHRGDDAIYIAASIEMGTTTGDTSSETILRVDRTTGNCTIIGRLATGFTEVPDIDNMAFDGERLYFYDGTPAPNAQISESFGRLYFADDWRDNAAFLPTLFYDEDYLRTTDLTVRCGEIYLGVDTEVLYAVDPEEPQLRSVAPNVFNGQTVSGITQFPRELTLEPDQDSLFLCADENLALVFPAFDAAITWSDSVTGQFTRTDLESGLLSVEAKLGNCPVFADSIALEVRDCADCDFAIPNIFSPNRDNQNDAFKLFYDPENCVISDIRIAVFNRWGQQVFQGEGDPAWDGNYRNKPVPADVYIYLIRFNIRTETGALQPVERSGEITLVR